MVDETENSTQAPAVEAPPRTLWSLLDRIAEFEKAIDPIVDRVDASIARLTERVAQLRAKAEEAHAMLDELEKLKL